MRTTVLAAVLIAGCGTDGSDEQPVFPADYATNYQQVRNCRRSLDHDMSNIRVLASPDALAPYMDRISPFPDRAVVLKEQYDGDDTTCSGEILTFTVMEKHPDSVSLLGWNWQKLDANRNVIATDVAKRCVACHTSCGVPPDGYDGTCTVP